MPNSLCKFCTAAWGIRTVKSSIDEMNIHGGDARLQGALEEGVVCFLWMVHLRLLQVPAVVVPCWYALVVGIGGAARCQTITL